MWRHCSPRVKSSQALLPEAKPRAIMLLRSSHEGYSDVAEGNIFSIASYPKQYSFYYMANLLFRWFADLPSVYVLFILIHAQHSCFCLQRLAYLVLLPAARTLSSDHLMTATKHVLNKTGVFDFLTFYYTAYRCFMSTSPNSYLIFYHI